MSPGLNATVNGEKSDSRSYAYANLRSIKTIFASISMTKHTILNSICCRNFALGMIARDKIDMIATR